MGSIALDSWSRTDLMALLAIFISVISVFFSLYSTYLNKNLEIKFLKFDRLGLTTVEKLYAPLDRLFEQGSSTPVSVYLQTITDTLVEVELYLIAFKDLFTQVELQAISEINISFSDSLYNQSHRTIKDFKTDYLSYKSKVLFQLYEFATNSTGLKDTISKGWKSLLN